MNQPVSINYSFDATQYDPTQMQVKHPVGKYPARITGTDLAAIKDDKKVDRPGHGMFVVEFTTPAGTIQKRYMLWFPDSAQTAEIAHRQLSALCHAVGVFRIEMANRGRELIGAECGIEVAVQERNANYNEVVKIYDRNGNEPGKAAPQAQPQAQAQPGFGQPAAQPQAGFGQAGPQAGPAAAASPFATPNPQARPATGAFGGPAPAAQTGGFGSQPQAAAAQGAQGWTQAAAPAAGQQAPWAT